MTNFLQTNNHQLRNKDVFGYGKLLQLKAIRYPIRQEIIDILSATGPSTIPELAALMSVRPESLYIHVRVLVDAGLVHKCAQRRTRKRPAGVYELVFQKRSILYDLNDTDKVAAYQEITKAILRLSARDSTAAFESGQAISSGEKRNLWVGRIVGWLSNKELSEVNEHIQALARLFQQSQPGPGKQMLAWTHALSPLTRRHEVTSKTEEQND